MKTEVSNSEKDVSNSEKLKFLGRKTFKTKYMFH